MKFADCLCPPTRQVKRYKDWARKRWTGVQGEGRDGGGGEGDRRGSFMLFAYLVLGGGGGAEHRSAVWCVTKVLIWSLPRKLFPWLIVPKKNINDHTFAPLPTPPPPTHFFPSWYGIQFVPVFHVRLMLKFVSQWHLMLTVERLLL